MAGRRRTQPATQQSALPVEDYRHKGATQLNNPPAAIAAEGRTPPVPKLTYAYSRGSIRCFGQIRPGRPMRCRRCWKRPRARRCRRRRPRCWRKRCGGRSRGSSGPASAKRRRSGGVAYPRAGQHAGHPAHGGAAGRDARSVCRSGLSYAQAVQFYQHDMDWANRLILGNSLQVMASLAQRENLAGKVQMIYLDPPYGIRFGSNFQPETGKRRCDGSRGGS